MLLLCLTILLAATVHDATACNTTTVEACVKAFTDKHPVTKEYTIAYSSEKLAEMCNDYEILQNCTKTDITGCTEADKKDYNLIHVTSQYLCTVESREIVSNHSACITKKEVKDDLGKCSTTFTTEAPKLNDTELCTAARTFANCSTTVFDKHCQKDAKNWYAKFLDVVLEPTKSEAKDCNFTAEAEGGHAASGCDAKGFEACVKTFTDKHSNFEYSVSYTEAQLNTMCTDYNTAHTCVTGKIKDCHEDVKKGWEMVHNSVTHFCSEESKKMIAKHGKCLDRKEVKDETTKCTKIYTEEAPKLKDATLCKAMHTFGNCLTGSVHKHCGSEAAKWYGETLDKIMEPAKKAIKDCNFKAGSAMTQYNILLLAMALIFSYFFSKV